MDKYIYGADTETVHGKPNSLQFYSEDVACNDIFFVNASNACETFIKWCKKRKPKVQHVLYIHKLDFDLIELLWGQHERFIENEFDFSIHGVHIRGIYGTPTYCRITVSSDITVHLVDSLSFFRGSLAAAAALYCPDMPKLRRPSDLGERRYGKKDAEFVSYAMRDAEVTYHIGRAIEELHREFDLTQCISIADMAARVFRHRFLSYTIPQPTEDIIHAALDSYHGGKNNLTVAPGWYRGVHSIDVSSAYPKAMRDMPAFARASLYKRYRVSKRVTQVPEYGVYCVTGKAAECAWPVIFGHDFKPLRGEVDQVWVQGFELNEALRSKELKITRVRGYYYDAEKDHQAPALRAFCDDFYARKNHETNEIRRHGYKLILNAVSGKFIQTRKRAMRCYVDIDSQKVGTASELVAGGMFHPFIASAITAHTRARMHSLEHYYEALHTATDGIFSTIAPKRRGPGAVRDKAQALGDLVLEASGDLLLVRNKCYILYAPDGDMPSEAFKGKHIRKYALHGFQGHVHQLEKLIATNKRTYTRMHANRLKESVKRGLTPNDFVERTYNLKVPPLKLRN